MYDLVTVVFSGHDTFDMTVMLRRYVSSSYGCYVVHCFSSLLSTEFAIAGASGSWPGGSKLPGRQAEQGTRRE